MTKSEAMQRVCDELAKNLFDWDGDNTKCRTCSSPVSKFRNELSEAEWRISGMCQECQDEIFGAD